MTPAAAVSTRSRTLLEEFKNFALEGNVVDLAVGVIIGTAFGKIVDSLVEHLIMPLVGLRVPGDAGDLGWKWVIGTKEPPFSSARWSTSSSSPLSSTSSSSSSSGRS